MTTSTQETAIQQFMADVISRNPGELEFHQAIHDAAESIIPFQQQDSRYADPHLLECLSEPDRVISFRVCWEDDQGNTQMNRGYRVQYSNAIGPYTGGLRFHPSVNSSVLKFLGFEQTLKNSLTTLPLGGAKGGSDFDPHGRSDAEIRRFCQSFMTELWRYIGEDLDIPAGDIGVGEREIGYLFGQYKRLRNEFTGALTGRGFAYGGSLLRPEATGYGSVYFAQEMLATRGEGLEGKRCLVSGSGNVAQYTTRKAIELGARVVTLSDSNGFVYDPDGIDEDKLAFVMDLRNRRRGRIREYAERFGCDYYEDKKPWDVPCDVAFPSATQNEINQRDAEALLCNGATVVAEGANMPSTTGAVQAFQHAKILYAPGKAANAGGVAVSGLEMSQASTRRQWTREEVDAQLHQIMSSIHAQCVTYGDMGDHVDYVRGANIAGFVRVADALMAYGAL